MTLENQSRATPSFGNGVTRNWPFSFPVYEENTLSLLLIDAATGETIEVVDPGEYTVTGVGDLTGGTIEYPLSPLDPLSSAFGVIALRTVPYTQQADINNQSGFHPNIIEQQLDRIVMQTQQLADEMGHTLRVDQGQNPPTLTELLTMIEETETNADRAETAATAAEGWAMAAESSADEAASVVNVAIRYDEAQSLSPSEQAQALTNIGMDPYLTDLAGKIDLTEKGQALGVAPLDASGKVDSAYLPVNGAYKGTWDADTNTPTLVSGVGVNGDFYIVGVAGTTSIDGISSWALGDQIRFNGTVWQKIANFDSVSSVAGKTGNVTLVKGDVGLGNVDNTSDVNKPVSSATQTALDGKVPTTRTVSAGTGLQGGGALSGNLTISLSLASQDSLELADTAMQPGAFGLGVTGAAPLTTNIDAVDQPAGHSITTTGGTTGTFPEGWGGGGMLWRGRYGPGWQAEILLGNANLPLDRQDSPFYRSYNDTTDVWTEWTRVVTAKNLRNPQLTVPMQHFERSIPLNLWEFGAKGADSNPPDETALIQAAIDKAVAERRTLVVPATFYRVDQIVLDAVYELTMEGVGGKPFFIPTTGRVAAGGDMFALRRANGAGFVYNSTAGEPSSDIIINEDAITFGAALGVAAGDYVGWTSNKPWYYDHRNQWWKGEMHEVARVNGNTVYFKDATHDAYDVSAEVLKVSSWKASRLELYNLGFGDVTGSIPLGGVTDGSNALTALSFNRCKQAVLEDIETYNFSGPHIAQRNNDGTAIRGYRGFGSGPFADTGYGLANLGCIYAHYQNIQAGGMRRLVDFSGTGTEGMGPSRNCIVDGFFVTGGGRDSAGVYYEPHGAKPSFGVGTHGPAEKITFRNGKATNVGRVGTARGRDIVFENIECYGWIPGECFQFYYGEGGVLRNCSYTSNDFGNKDQQGVAISTGRRCPDFVKFGLEAALDGDGLPSKWQTNLPTIIEGNVCEGLTDSFINFRPGQTGSLSVPNLSNSFIKNNKAYVAAASGDFFMFRNGTGGTLWVHNSEWWDNDAYVRGDSSIGVEHDDGTIQFGLRIASGSLMQDRPSKIGPSTYRVVIENDNYIRLKCMEPHPTSTTARRLVITGKNGDVTINFDGWIEEDDATPISIYTGANINFTSNPQSLNGSTGTSGKLTVGLAGTGALWIENRRGSTRVFDVTVL